MSTVTSLKTARECVFEDPSILAMGEYENIYGQRLFKICYTKADLNAFINSSFVKKESIIWHYMEGQWLIQPEEEGEDID